MQGKIDMYGNRIVGKRPSARQPNMNQQRTPPRQTASEKSNSRTEPNRQPASDSGGGAKGLWEDPLVRMATYYTVGKAAKETAKTMGFQLPPSHKPMKLDPFHSTHMDGFSGESTSRKVSNYYEIKTMSNGNEYLIDTARNTNVEYYDRMKDATFQDLKRIGRGNLLLTLVK